MVPEVRVGLLLHFFQPWWQFPDVLARVNEECYRPVFELVEKCAGNFTFTANVQATLLDYWATHDRETLGRLRSAVASGKIELMGGAGEHPILPLIPRREAIRQIARDAGAKLVHDVQVNSRGFFFPEMAHSPDVLTLARELGYGWTVLQDNSLPFSPPFNYITETRGMNVFLRSAHWSRYIWDEHMDFYRVREKMRYELPNWVGRKKAYIAIAMDAETFGHHATDDLLNRFFSPALTVWGSDGTLTPFGTLLKLFPSRPVSDLRSGSWSTTEEDFVAGNPYPLWRSPGNALHALYAELLEVAFGCPENQVFTTERLQMANSCHTWWVSKSRYRPDFFMFGVERAMRVIRGSGNAEAKSKGENILVKITRQL